MAKVEFKSKVRKVYNVDDTLAYCYLDVPELNRQHVNMSEFRQHPKFGPYANSDLFPSMLRRAAEALGVKDRIKMDAIPAGVAINTRNFLAVVSFDL